MKISKTYYHEYIGAFLDKIENGKAQSFSRNSTTENTRPGFYGKDSTNDCLKLAREGWPEGLARLTKNIQENVQSLGEIVRNKEYVRTPAGFMPLVPAVLANSPDNMLTIRRKQTVRPVISLTLEKSTSWRLSPAQIENFGAACMSVIDLLESSGVSVECLISFTSESVDDRSVHQTLIKVKDAGQPLDQERVAFALIHVGMHRRLWWREQECYYPRGFSDQGYGNNFYITPNLARQIAPKGSLMLACLRDESSIRECSSRAGALKVVLDAIKAEYGQVIGMAA